MSGGLARWQEGGFVTVPLPAPDGNPTESVTVCPESDGDLWIGTLNHGLMRLHAGEITRQQTPWETIRVLFSDSRGQLWVGGLVSLFRLGNGQISQFGSAEGFVDSHAIGALAEDSAGAIWIGTGPGDLWRFHGGKFTRFTPPPEWPSVRFSAVLPDTNGVIWVGTLGGGLLRFYQGQFTRCTKLNGLPDDNVSQLLDSHDGHLWAGTYAGIFRVSKADLEAVGAGRAPRVPCRVYGRFDGLPALECSSGFQPSCWRSSDGDLCFSTANGVVTVNPLDISTNRVPPRTIIEELLVDGRPRSLPPRSHAIATAKASPALEIEPGRHYLQFRFTGLSFVAPDGVRFRVKLEGVDRDWQSTAGQRLIGYGPLLPGDYRFRVLACNNDGVWNEEGDTLAFTVLPYVWETWLFKVSLSLATLGALGIAVALAQRRRYRRKLERVERQREMERERTRIAQDLHDDLGTTLTQISMLSALANRDQTPAGETKELIQQVRARAREMVTALDEIVWAVNPKNDSITGLVNYLGHFAEEFFRPIGIRCRLEIPEDLPSHPLPADVRHHLFLAFKEAVNNAARHSGAACVRVRVQTHASEILIVVADDGHGFAAQAGPGPEPGNGLSNMHRRLEQAGGHTEVQSVPGQGTTVTFHLPLN
jgi:signal transduction histidine kinase